VQELVKATLGSSKCRNALFSTLGRTAARGLDAALAMIWLKEYYGQLMEQIKIKRSPHSWPVLGTQDLAKRSEGVGLTEAPRGALAHWIKIKTALSRIISSCANHLEGSPRDAKGTLVL